MVELKGVKFFTKEELGERGIGGNNYFFVGETTYIHSSML